MFKVHMTIQNTQLNVKNGKKLKIYKSFQRKFKPIMSVISL